MTKVEIAQMIYDELRADIDGKDHSVPAKVVSRVEVLNEPISVKVYFTDDTASKWTGLAASKVMEGE